MGVWDSIFGGWDDRAARHMDAENHKRQEVRHGQVVWTGILGQSKAKGAPTKQDRAARAARGRKQANYKDKKAEAERARQRTSWWDK